MLIEKDILGQGIVNCIIHYIYFLPKLRNKGYGQYILGKAFSSDPEIENEKVYALTKLIHDYNPSEYEEPVRQ